MESLSNYFNFMNSTKKKDGKNLIKKEYVEIFQNYKNTHTVWYSLTGEVVATSDDNIYVPSDAEAELNVLYTTLKEAIEIFDFENAIILRDRINVLEATIKF